MPDLAFRRQFFLGPETPDLLGTWKRHQVNQRNLLAIHPDLPHTRVDHGGRSLILLGYVLDPRHPGRGDQAILDAVLHGASTTDAVLASFDPLAGRWAAIYLTGNDVLVFHDAAGVRQVYHCRDADGGVRCGSSPGLLARVTGRLADIKTRHELESAGLLGENATHFWPGSGSPVLGVNRLLPNHYLDATTGQATRYWPRSPIPTVDQDTAAARSTTALTGVIQAAAARYPLALSITAGLDSRLLLAASHGVTDRLDFYTLKKPGMHASTPDLRVPRKMLGDLGLRRRVIPVRPTRSGPIIDAISASVSPIHQSTVNQAAALWSDPPRRAGQPWVTLNGNVAEVAECYLRRLPVTPANLARNTKMASSSFAAQQLDAWHTAAASAIAASGIDPWDLFYWEQKTGGWFATVRTEFDVVEEAVTPYNSRAWLEGMLGVAPELRSAPDFPFFRRLIGDLWPQLLDYPINPPDKMLQLNYRTRSVAKSALSVVRPSARRAGEVLQP